jgi:hypothetical protein
MWGFLSSLMFLILFLLAYVFKYFIRTYFVRRTTEGHQENQRERSQSFMHGFFIFEILQGVKFQKCPCIKDTLNWRGSWSY